MLETGEIVQNLPLFAGSSDPHIWITTDPCSLLDVMLHTYEVSPYFNFQIIETTEVDAARLGMSVGRARLTRFGFSKGRGKRPPGIRHRGMHLVWNPYDMSRAPGDHMDGFTHRDLLTFGADVRDWCRETNVPLPTSLAGIAASLLRDSRFWPDARGRVPTATNERVRQWLPGVYQTLRAPTSEAFDGVALDQRSAYHRAAQEVATPDPTTLFARGYYLTPETSPLWCVHGDEVYNRTVQQPGVIYITYSAPPPRKHEHYPPAIEPGIGRAAVWTNEVEYIESQGVTIHGIVAAWTSSEPDHGLALYGTWAADQISAADGYRKRWLKPTLHATYGLLGMRVRQVTVHHRYPGWGDAAKVIMGAGWEVPTRARELPPLPSPTTNVAALGILQAEIRTRSLRMANALSMEGCKVLHIHADGLHVTGDLPLLPDSWTVEPRTNLVYLDRVSWLSDQGHTLPGRDDEARALYENGKHLDRLTEQRAVRGA